MALPCLIFEDEHLLVVNKPAGLNTHAPSPYGGEGLYDWLRNRERRWARLAIIHRLDKETSGVMIFAKTPLANRSLTDQFSRRQVKKEYLLLTDREVPQREFNVRSELVRAGEKYVSRPVSDSRRLAETRFHPAATAERCSILKTIGDYNLPGPARLPARCHALIAEPLTGRTHQIRVHAADGGFPVFGDTLYGGAPASRVFLHAAKLSFLHPASGAKLNFTVPADFGSDVRLGLRMALMDAELTNAWRCLHGASDAWPGWYVERVGDYLVSLAERPLDDAQRKKLGEVAAIVSAKGGYHKILARQVRRSNSAETGPRIEFGAPATERFVIRENGLQFEMSFQEGYSTGLFLDQRENRRRLMTGHVGSGFALYPCSSGADQHPGREARVLNTFAYTCAFSVAAARAGAFTTSLDLSKKYLEWGKRNFALNDLDPSAHDFIYGDVFDWLRRLAKRESRYHVIIVDPPTFSQSKESGVFRAEKDFDKLVALALPLLEKEGVLLASSNAAGWPPERFLAAVSKPIQLAGRKILQTHYVPQPPDFPIARAEPAYLKTVWLRVA